MWLAKAFSCGGTCHRVHAGLHCHTAGMHEETVLPPGRISGGSPHCFGCAPPMQRRHRCHHARHSAQLPKAQPPCADAVAVGKSGLLTATKTLTGHQLQSSALLGFQHCAAFLPVAHQLLEMAVKNSVPAFFQHLAVSELFADMMRVSDPTRRVRAAGAHTSSALRGCGGVCPEQGVVRAVTAPHLHV